MNEMVKQEIEKVSSFVEFYQSDPQVSLVVEDILRIIDMIRCEDDVLTSQLRLEDMGDSYRKNTVQWKLCQVVSVRLGKAVFPKESVLCLYLLYFL